MMALPSSSVFSVHIVITGRDGPDAGCGGGGRGGVAAACVWCVAWARPVVGLFFIYFFCCRVFGRVFFLLPLSAVLCCCGRSRMVGVLLWFFGWAAMSGGAVMLGLCGLWRHCRLFGRLSELVFEVGFHLAVDDHAVEVVAAVGSGFLQSLLEFVHGGGQVCEHLIHASAVLHSFRFECDLLVGEADGCAVVPAYLLGWRAVLDPWEELVGCGVCGLADAGAAADDGGLSHSYPHDHPVLFVLILRVEEVFQPVEPCGGFASAVVVFPWLEFLERVVFLGFAVAEMVVFEVCVGLVFGFQEQSCVPGAGFCG